MADHQLDILGVIAVGGFAGAEARYGAGVLWPHTASGFPSTTLLINVVGCALIGVLMTVITEFVEPHRLVRPLLGVGVLGGFTTFSTYCTDALGLIQAGRPAAALMYVAATPVVCLIAVWAAVAATRLAGGAVARPVADGQGERS